MYYKIPLNSIPNQNFKCTIPVDGKKRSLIFDVKYNREAQYWTLTLTDALNGIILVDSLPLITGEYPSANLLEQYEYLNVGCATIIKADPDLAIDNPDDKTLGTGFFLVWGDNI